MFLRSPLAVVAAGAYMMAAHASAAEESSTDRTAGAQSLALRAAIGTLQTSDRGGATSARTRPALFVNMGLTAGEERHNACSEEPHDPFQRIEADIWLSLDFDGRAKIRQNGSRVGANLLDLQCASPAADRVEIVQTELLTGVEHFRPGITSSAVTWDDSLVEGRPHLQYYVWEVAGPRASVSTTVSGIHLVLSGAAFPVVGANSSLQLHDIKEADEARLDPVFKSKTATRQNYYFSFGGMSEAGFTLSWSSGLSVTARQRFFYFRPLLRVSEVWDAVGRTTGALAYDLTPFTAIQIEYSRMDLLSELNGSREGHGWESFLWSARWKLS